MSKIGLGEITKQKILACTDPQPGEHIKEFSFAKLGFEHLAFTIQYASKKLEILPSALGFTGIFNKEGQSCKL